MSTFVLAGDNKLVLVFKCHGTTHSSASEVESYFDANKLFICVLI